MTGLISPAVRAARRVAVAAVESPSSAYGVVDAIVFALDSAQLLQSLETAREFEQAKTDARRRRTAWRLAYQRAQGRGWAADRAGARSRELQTALQDMLGALLTMQMERDAERKRIAEALAERHSTNEALDDAVQALAYLETTAGLVAEYRVPLSEDAWLVVRREPCGDRWAILGSHLRGGRRPVFVGGRWVTLPVVGPDGAWVYESAQTALDTAVGLAAEGGDGS